MLKFNAREKLWQNLWILQVWDSDIIETAEERYYSSDTDGLVDAIQQNITVSDICNFADLSNKLYYFIREFNARDGHFFSCFVIFNNRMIGQKKLKAGRPAVLPSHLAQTCTFHNHTREKNTQGFEILQSIEELSIFHQSSSTITCFINFFQVSKFYLSYTGWGYMNVTDMHPKVSPRPVSGHTKVSVKVWY